VQILRKQLDRLDPAHKCIALQGFVDNNLTNRLSCIEQMLAGAAGCPKSVACDTIHRGKFDARVPTKVTLIEFASNTDREKALVLLSGKTLHDSTGALLKCKCASTSSQRDRNTKIQNAEKEIQKMCVKGETVKIEWTSRRVLCNNVPAFVQHKEDSSGDFLPPFTNLRV